MKLITLSPLFYREYADCPEILTKPTRPYVCLKVVIDGVVFAIPFRHHITHKWAFLTYGEAGLDYSKAVVIADPAYIGMHTPTIEQREFDALKGKETVIINGMRRFLAVYKKAVKYADNDHYRAIRNCSALQYFHRELHLPPLESW